MTNFDDCVISTRVRLARNIKNLPFPQKLSDGDERVYSVLMAGVKRATDELGCYDFFKLDSMSDFERMVFFERHLVSKEMLKKQSACALVLRNDERLSVMICEEDHVRAQAILPGLDLIAAYKNVEGFDDKLAKNLPIAFDEKLGYLTSCPTNLGTAMRASVMMFLPALTQSGAIAELTRVLPEQGMTVRGNYGEGTDAEGFMYQISNQNSFGLSEGEILKKVNTTVLRICELERQARDKAFDSAKMIIKDKIMRAFGLISNACIISYAEFLRLHANIRLGVYHGLLDISYDTLNQLISDTQSACLCKMIKKRLDERGCDIARAVIIKERLNK